jgi:hypothetical protein
MATDVPVEVRPRTAGEILDDAWRLYLADAPLLLALSGIFLAPAFLTFLWLLTHQRPAFFIAAGVAILIQLTGLGSAACQEAFRLRAEGKPASLGGCLWAALRRGAIHAAARSQTLLTVFVGSLLLLLPGLAAWISSATIHPILAGGEKSLLAALRAAGQEAQRQPGKAAVVVLSRLVLLFLGVVNLHLLIRVGVWTAEQLAGFDTAFIGVMLSLSNIAYLTALTLATWLLLSPYAEAANYLLHVDSQARYRGLDLWYRVRSHFPEARRTRTGLLLLVVGASLLACNAASAKDRMAVLQEARQGIQSMIQEVSQSEPFPGGQRWSARLKELAERLDQGTPPSKSRYRWFHRAIAGFPHRGRESCLLILKDLDRRMALLEDNLRLQTPSKATNQDGRLNLSNEELKRLLPPRDDAEREEQPPQPRRPQARQAESRKSLPKLQRDGEESGRKAASGPGVISPQPTGGLSTFGWMTLAGLLTAVVILAVIFRWQRRLPTSKPAASQIAGLAPSLETILTQPDEYSVAGLWKQADDLATGGRFRDAVRTLYLGVLALLHRANFIRFERTRTNGEYAQQLRSRQGLHEPFRHLTDLFDLKWYSESTCEVADFRTCRDWAEEIRQGVRDEG